MSKSKVKPVPKGYRSVTPYMIVDGATRALDFYARVFGAKERMRMPAPGGKVAMPSSRSGTR
jgi:PhnB protein